MAITKKLLLGLGALSFVTLPILSFVSCSSDSKESPFDLGIADEVKSFYGDKLNSLPVENKKRVMLITAGGKVNDKSFNQSANGALNLYKEQVGFSGDKEVMFRETLNDTQLDQMYTEAMTLNINVLVLTGFQQADTFKVWLEKPGNKEKFIASKAIVVGVDWNGSSFVPAGQFFGLGFKTQDASWVVGMAASEYLSTTSSPYLSSFGGGVFDGVTDFNNGFLQGMKDWNKTNPTQKVQFRSGNKKVNEIYLSSGFEPTQDNIEEINNLLGTSKTESPQIILPVAGSLTNNTLTAIQQKRSNQLVIGVDSNQSLALPSFASKFFSSIEKRVALAVYKSLVMLSGVPLNYKDDNSDDKGFEGDFVSIANATESKLAKNTFVKYGFEKGFVGYSKSTIKDGAQVDLLLQKYFDEFTKTKPTFEDIATDPTKNQTILNGLVTEINAEKYLS